MYWRSEDGHAISQRKLVIIDKTARRVLIAPASMTAEEIQAINDRLQREPAEESSHMNLTVSLTEQERNVLDQALMDYEEGISDSAASAWIEPEDRAGILETIESLQRKLLS